MIALDGCQLNQDHDSGFFFPRKMRFFVTFMLKCNFLGLRLYTVLSMENFHVLSFEVLQRSN